MSNYPDYCYTKKYKLSPTGSRVLTNPEPFFRYVETKVQALLEANSSEDLLKVKLNILREFEQILAYDITYTISPAPLGTFIDEKSKKNFLILQELRNDFHSYLGNIFFNYHKALLDLNIGFPNIESSTDVIDYENLYLHVREDYGRALTGEVPPSLFTPNAPISNPQVISINVKGHKIIKQKGPVESALQKVRSWPHAYSATFILPALIESALLARITVEIIHSFCQKFQEIVERGKEVSIEEKRLLISFTEGQQFENIVFEPKSHQETMECLWKTGCKYQIFNPDQSDMHKILLDQLSENNPITLGRLIDFSYVKQIVRPEYINLMKNLFGVKKINLRNCIMHGHANSFDYLSLGFAAVMMQLYWDIVGEDVFIRKILNK